MQHRSRERESLLRHLKRFEWTPKAVELYLEAVDMAKNLGIKVIGIDMPESERLRIWKSLNTLDVTSRRFATAERRDPWMAGVVQTVLDQTANGKVVVYVGGGHARKNTQLSSAAAHLQSQGEVVTSVNIIGCIKNASDTEIGRAVGMMGLSDEKFMVPDVNNNFDWYIHLPEVDNRVAPTRSSVTDSFFHPPPSGIKLPPDVIKKF